MPPTVWPFELGRYLNVADFLITVLLSFVVALVAAVVGYARSGGAVAARAAGWVLLAGSVASTLMVTVFRQGFVLTVRLLLRPSAHSPLSTGSNWVPFRDILGEAHHINHTLGLVNILGNVALFVPTGILAALLFRRTCAAFVVAPVVSTVIEFTQLFAPSQSADIDDIILNTAGGAIGVLIGMLIHRLIRTRDHVPDSPTTPARAPSDATGVRPSDQT